MKSHIKQKQSSKTKFNLSSLLLLAAVLPAKAWFFDELQEEALSKQIAKENAAREQEAERIRQAEQALERELNKFEKLRMKGLSQSQIREVHECEWQMNKDFMDYLLNGHKDFELKFCEDGKPRFVPVPNPEYKAPPKRTCADKWKHIIFFRDFKGQRSDCFNEKNEMVREWDAQRTQKSVKDKNEKHQMNRPSVRR